MLLWETDFFLPSDFPIQLFNTFWPIRLENSTTSNKRYRLLCYKKHIRIEDMKLHLFDPLACWTVCDSEPKSFSSFGHGEAQNLWCGLNAGRCPGWRRHGDGIVMQGPRCVEGRRLWSVQVRVSGVGQSVSVFRKQTTRQRHVLHVVIVRAASVEQKRGIHQAQRGHCRTSRWLLRVVGQRVPSTQYESHTLTNGHRLKELDHVCMGGSQDANVVDVDDHVAWAEEKVLKLNNNWLNSSYYSKPFMNNSWFYIMMCIMLVQVYIFFSSNIHQTELAEHKWFSVTLLYIALSGPCGEASRQQWKLRNIHFKWYFTQRIKHSMVCCWRKIIHNNMMWCITSLKWIIFL